MIRRLTRIQFDREFGETYARVFAHPRADRWEEAEYVSNPYHDRSWQVILLPDGLETFGIDPEMHAEIIDKVSDAYEAWPPFFDTIAQMDIEHLIQTDRYIDMQDEPEDIVRATLYEPTMEDVGQTLSSGLTWGEFDLFSPDGRWGMYCANVERYSLLGGDEAFMRVFIEKSGGIEAIQQRFYRFTEWMWPEPEYAGLRRDFWSLTGWKPPSSLA